MSNNHVLEVAIFKVKADYVGDVATLRADLREALKGFPGFLEFAGYVPTTEGGLFADIVKWDIYENAVGAAKAFENGDPRFLPYMNAIEEVTFMGHFHPERN